MTTTEVAALVVAAASVVGVVVLGVFLARLNRTVRQVGEAVQRQQGRAAALEVRGELTAPAGDGLPLRARIPKDPAVIATKVARHNPVLDVSQPVIKVLALASGTGRAASRLRRTRRER